MLLSKRPAHVVRHWRTLLATLALTTAGAHAQLQTAKLVKDANVAKQGLPARIDWIARVGGERAVFPMDTLATGKELWTSDGTAKGTVLLKDIVPGLAGSNPQQGGSFANDTKAAFLAQSGSYVYDENSPPELDLWVSDGTAAGTVRVLESPFPQELGITSLRAGTTNGVFLEDKGWIANGLELFFSDGTAAGTRSLNPFIGDTDDRKFSNSENYYTSGQWCFFVADTDDLWRTDGTDAGTTKIASFDGLSPKWGRLIGDTYFVNVVKQAGIKSELWSCPAAGGTPVRLGPPDGASWKNIMAMEPAGNELVITIQDSANKPSLWTSNGTVAGTQRIPVTLPGQSTESSVGYALISRQDEVYFSATQTGLPSAVWKSDGTAAGTTLLKTMKPPYGIYTYMWAGGDSVYFLGGSERGFQVWRTQGTAATTQLMKGTPYISTAAGVPNILPTASSLYLLPGQGTPGEFLARPKNAKGGTLQLTRPETINGNGVPPHPVGSPPYQIYNGNVLEFVNTGRGQELWQIDAKGKSRSLFKLSLALQAGGTLGFNGTTANGELFTRFGGDSLAQVFIMGGKKSKSKVLAEDPAARGFDFTKVGDSWYFSPDRAGAFATAILKTDGSETGTFIVKAADGSTPTRLGNMVSFQGSLWFIAVSNSKRQLWKTDGSPAGTVKVADTWYGDANEYIEDLSVANGKLYFSVWHNSKQYIWQSDGTAAGTAVIGPAFTSIDSSIVDLAGVPLFQARLGLVDEPQWWVIGNGGVTRIESKPLDLSQPTDSSSPKYAVAGSQLFFCAETDGDVELWVTNGAIGNTAGTHRVKDIKPGTTSSRPAGMVAVGNHVYFIATDDAHGRELWRSDGTEAGTVLVADVEPGPTSSSPYGLKAMGGKLYFSAERRTTGRELYTIDLPQ